MAMSKKDFISLADRIRAFEQTGGFDSRKQAQRLIDMLADFCQSQNPRFMRERWLGYIDGENGKNGGQVKTAGRKLPTGHFSREVQQ
jgi:hypothetical protein